MFSQVMVFLLVTQKKLILGIKAFFHSNVDDVALKPSMKRVLFGSAKFDEKCPKVCFQSLMLLIQVFLLTCFMKNHVDQHDI